MNELGGEERGSHTLGSLIIYTLACSRTMSSFNALCVQHPCVWHDSFICVTWRIRMCDMTDSHVWHDSSIYVTWLIHMCDMTHSHEWRGSFICVTWSIHIYDTTHDSFMWVTWRIHTRLYDTTQDSFIRMNALSCHSHEWVMCCVVQDMTHSYVWHDPFICVTSHEWQAFFMSCVWYVDSFMCDTWLLVYMNKRMSESCHVCSTHSCANHDSFMCDTWLIHVWTMTHGTWLMVYMNTRPVQHMWHDSLIWVT